MNLLLNIELYNFFQPILGIFTNDYILIFNSRKLIFVCSYYRLNLI
jgi:hypothetical protein